MSKKNEFEQARLTLQQYQRFERLKVIENKMKMQKLSKQITTAINDLTIIGSLTVYTLGCLVLAGASLIGTHRSESLAGTLFILGFVGLLGLLNIQDRHSSNKVEE